MGMVWKYALEVMVWENEIMRTKLFWIPPEYDFIMANVLLKTWVQVWSPIKMIDQLK